MAQRNKIRLRWRFNFRIPFLSALTGLVLSRGLLKSSALIALTVIMLHYEALAAFRFHIQEEPLSLDPLHSHLTIASYVLNVLYAPLMIYQGGKLKPWGARTCRWSQPLILDCELRKDWLWSDGRSVVADDLVYAIQQIFAEKSARLDGFLSLVNAHEVLEKKLEPTHLGVSARGPRTLRFRLSHPDSEFLYKLIDPAVTPRRRDILPDGHITAGPYIFEKRVPGRSLLFHTNAKFFIKAERPEIEVLIVDSDSTAVSLFEKGELNFHRRLPPESEALFKARKGFFSQPLYRFDYIGMGSALEYQPELRRRLTLSLDKQFQEQSKLFPSNGPGGCFGIPVPIVPHKMCLEKAKILPYAPGEIEKLPNLSLTVATQGGDTVIRQAEHFQQGWKTALHLNVEIKTQEVKQLEGLLRTDPPPLFRRGVNLERPTCLAALELFHSKSPNNFIHFVDKVYDESIDRMRESRDEKLKAKLCDSAGQRLLKSYRMIPLGEPNFFMISDQKFDGFQLNPLNQLDVSRLRHRTTSLDASR